MTVCSGKVSLQWIGNRDFLMLIPILGGFLMCFPPAISGIVALLFSIYFAQVHVNRICPLTYGSFVLYISFGFEKESMKNKSKSVLHMMISTDNVYIEVWLSLSYHDSMFYTHNLGKL